MPQRRRLLRTCRSAENDSPQDFSNSLDQGIALPSPCPSRNRLCAPAPLREALRFWMGRAFSPAGRMLLLLWLELSLYERLGICYFLAASGDG